MTKSDDQQKASMNCSILEQITPLAQQINSLDLDKIAHICTSDIPMLIGARFSSLYILDETTNILHLQSYNHPFLLNKIVSLNQYQLSPMVMAVRSKEVLNVPDIDVHKKPVIKKSHRPFAKNYQTKNCLIAPLVCQDRVVGVLNLSDKENGEAFTVNDIEVIQLVSQLIGASVGNIKLFEKIQKQAATDGLTGLVNHRAFYEALEKELWRSRRYGGTISLIMVDVDSLKKVNDTHGHRAGDKAIREISKKIKQCIRQIDTAARYGGDEFAIILPNTALADATIVAERMVKSVSDANIAWNRRKLNLSISVGLGQYDANTSPEDITNRSDEALYHAKQAGRNTVKIFESSKI